jgi:hypothetical protein
VSEWASALVTASGLVPVPAGAPMTPPPSLPPVVRQVSALPPQLAAAAEANRAVRAAAAAAGEGRDLYGEEASPYGESALRGYLRSLPHIFEAHHPDLVAADRAQRAREQAAAGTAVAGQPANLLANL